MGNAEQNFCCDHAAELNLFESNRKFIISPKKKDILRNVRGRNERKFSKDDTSIIDQLEIRPETQREERLSMKVRKSKEKENDRQILTQRQRASNFYVDKQKSSLAQRERKWYEYKLKELQEEKQRERERVRMELQSEYRASLKQRKKSKQEPQKKYDFQFIVNYRN